MSNVSILSRNHSKAPINFLENLHTKLFDVCGHGFLNDDVPPAGQRTDRCNLQDGLKTYIVISCILPCREISARSFLLLEYHFGCCRWWRSSLLFLFRFCHFRSSGFSINRVGCNAFNRATRSEQVVITILELGLIYAGIKLLPAEPGSSAGTAALHDVMTRP